MTAVSYAISDPIDIDEGVMLTFFLRECEKQSRIIRREKALPEEPTAYAEAMFKAYEADARSFAIRAAGDPWPWRPRMADMPSGPDS